MKDELNGKIMKKFVALSAKTCSYLTGNNDKDKKGKGTKKCGIKRKLKFKDHKNFLKETEVECKINQLEKRKVSTESLQKS